MAQVPSRRPATGGSRPIGKLRVAPSNVEGRLAAASGRRLTADGGVAHRMPASHAVYLPGPAGWRRVAALMRWRLLPSPQGTPLGLALMCPLPRPPLSTFAEWIAACFGEGGVFMDAAQHPR